MYMAKSKSTMSMAQDLTRVLGLRGTSAMVVAVAFLMLLSIAGAQDNPAKVVRVPVSVTASVSPCPGESLKISGRIFIRVERTLKEDGSTKVKTSTSLQGLEVQGVLSNTQYQFSDVGPEERNFTCPPQEKCPTQLAQAFKLTGTGPSNDISGFVIAKFDELESGDLKAQIERFDFVCHLQD